MADIPSIDIGLPAVLFFYRFKRAICKMLKLRNFRIFQVSVIIRFFAIMEPKGENEVLLGMLLSSEAVDELILFRIDDLNFVWIYKTIPTLNELLYTKPSVKLTLCAVLTDRTALLTLYILYRPYS